MLDAFWLELCLIGIIALLAGFVHSSIGFGFGIVAISLIPFVIDVRSAHIVVSTCSVPMLAMTAWAYREGIVWKAMRPALLGAALSLPLGLALFLTLPLDWLVRGTGLAILSVVLIGLKSTPQAADQPASSAACFVAGAMSGFLGGAVSIAGPPIATFALKQGWPPIQFKAFIGQCMLVIATYKVGLLLFQDVYDLRVTADIISGSVLSIVGVQIGAWASRKIAPHRFRRVVASALIVVSVMMIWRGQPSTPDSQNDPDASLDPAATQPVYDP